MARLMSSQLVPLLLLLAGVCAKAAIPRLSAFRKSVTNNYGVDQDLPPGYETYYYTQTLDHFNYKPESYITFQQRYILNTKYWGGANTSSPIFVYTGEEDDVTYDVPFAGFIPQLASRFNALLVYIEHRYYGVSMPFGLEDEAYANASTLGFFSSAQALADYSEVVIDLKKNMSAENCPAIAIGASYGGMLASWFRLKYPHVVYGALASSAPILYFDDITPQDGYFAVVTKDFRNTSESCYNTIKESWSEIDSVAAQPNGLQNLSQIFSTCNLLNSSHTLKDYLQLLYMGSAQYDNWPSHRVEQLCSAIDEAVDGINILGRIAAGLNFTDDQPPCNDIPDMEPDKTFGWTWQSCTEMVIPMGVDSNDTMFQPDPFNIDNYSKQCEALYGITPRPHWVTTEYGGHDIKSVLGNFASNIIFSNGLRDPYSSGGVLQNISDSVVAVYTEEGAHCLDLHTPTASDPDWLVSQRDTETNIIAGWLAKYYNATNV